MRCCLGRRTAGLVLWVAACGAPNAPRWPAQSGPFSIGVESFVDDGPFRVVFAGPQGESGPTGDVTIAFSRPLRPPGVLASQTLAPATVRRVHDGALVEGTWRWFGERTAVFWPSDRGFANATEYEIAVEPSLHAFDGSVLAPPPPPLRFVSQRPALVSVGYEWQADADRHVVSLEFNQETPPELLPTAVHIEGKGPHGIVRVPFTVVGSSAADPQKLDANRFELSVDRSIATLEDVAVVTSPGLASREGPLTNGKEQRLSVPDVGPQKVEIYCTEPGADDEKANVARCSLERGDVSLRLSKPVRERDLARHLVVSRPRAPGRPLTDDWITFVDLSDFMRLEPGAKYKVTLKAGLLADDDDRLAVDRVFDFSTVDHEPRLTFRDFSGDAVVESARAKVLLNLESMNVAAFEVVEAPLDETQLFGLLAAERRTTEKIRALPNAITRTITTRGRKNQATRASFELPTALRSPSDPGLFAVATRAAGLADDVRILSVTDLGLSTKWSPFGGLVWVTQLSSGAPVANASVSLRRRGSEVYATTTNGEGIATIPPAVTAMLVDEPAEPSVLVRAGRDLTFASLSPLDSQQVQPLGLLFSERRLYRPGETAYLKGLVRALGPAGLVTTPGQRLNVEAVDSDGHAIFTTSVVLDAFGGFSCELPIPRDVRLGYAQVRAWLGDGPPPKPQAQRSHYGDDWLARASFIIDEFRSVEMKVAVSAARKEYLAGDSAELALHAKYLFGAPMHDAVVNVQATRSQADFAPPGLRNYVTSGRGFWPTPTGTVHEADVSLDAAGAAKPTFVLVLPNQIGPEQISVEASIADVTKSFAVDDRTSFIVHPSELYVGVRLDPSRPAPWLGKPIRAEVAAAGWYDQARAGVPVHLELHYQKDDSQPPVSTGHGCDLVTTVQGAGCELPVTEPGTYWLAAQARDSRGKLASAATSFHVAKPAGPPPKPPKPAAKPRPRPPEPPPPPFDERCKLPSADGYSGALWLAGASWEEPFAVGGSLHTCLRGNGFALLTQEREGVLGQQGLRIAAPGVLHDLPILGEYHPNVTLALHTVSGRTGPFPPPDHADEDHPWFSEDAREIRVDRPAEAALKVALDVGTVHRPGDTFEARVRVTDGNGKAAVAQVTLWAVDEGVLQLEPFHVPDPTYVFDQERWSQVQTADSRERLLWDRGPGSHSMHAPQVREGTTATGGRMHFGRSIFRPTAWFLPSLLTGPDGTAKARVKLPDNVTGWRVFAVAANAQAGFGSAESAFVTQQPLTARPALPRFLRSGDRFDATVVIDSMERRALDVIVQMQAGGALAGSGKTTLKIAADGHVPVRFPVIATGTGKGHVSFSVTAPGGLSDTVTVDEEVSMPATLETIVLSGETRSRVDEPLGDLSLARSDVGGLDFRIAATPLVGMAESLRGLLDYPYGCTEQLSSRLVPLVRLRGMARELGIALPSDVDARVRSAIASLLTHQREDGGFGFWRESQQSDVWLTVGAVSALVASRQAGFAVAQAPLDRALSWLEKLEGLNDTARALREDAWVSLGRPREVELRALAKKAELPLFARALLARDLAPLDHGLAQQVLASVASQARLSGAIATVPDEPSLAQREYLSSDARTTALALRAFVAVEPHDPLTAKLVRGLLSLRRSGRWSTTQESAWAVTALDDARALYPPPTNGAAPLQLWFDGTEQARGPAATVTTGTIPMSKLQSSPAGLLSFRAEGAGLFYEAALRYARKQPPASPLEHGIHVARSLKLTRGHASVAASNLRVGDTVEVDVVLGSAVPRELVVLDDPIPAGCEAVNQTFANSDPRSLGPSFWVTHRELRDDRVLSFLDRLPAGLTHVSYQLRVIAPGRFAHPPAKAECMYAPDVFGRTEASVVETN